MNCHEFRTLLEPYLDSELDVRMCQKLQEHVGACPSCAAMLSAQERMDRQLQTALRRGERTGSVWGALENQIALAAVGGESCHTPATERPAETDRGRATSWRWWLWPSPNYYAGLACVWLMLLTMHLVSREPAAARRAAARPTPPSVRTALAGQHRLLAELLDGESKASQPSPTDTPSSRSDRKPQLRNV